MTDRRNILIYRWATPLTDDEAATLGYALERGIEVAFQLEDSELTSERLPDTDHRGRILLVEAAEGGAGVLRRLVNEPDAIRRVARAALDLMHVDPDTGDDREDACVRGCYRCLLSYGNQLEHEAIDRRVAVPVLRRLADATLATTHPTIPTQARSADPAKPTAMPSDATAHKLMRLIVAEGLRRPEAVDADVEGVRVDLHYPSADPPAAVIVERGQDTSSLFFSGLNVVTVEPSDDIEQIISANPAVFGVSTQHRSEGLPR